MKKLIYSWLLCAALMVWAMISLAQTKVAKDKDGNYITVTPIRDTVNHDTPIGRTFTDKDGKAYPVYRGPRGGLYYEKISASGTKRKVYIKQA